MTTPPHHTPPVPPVPMPKPKPTPEADFTAEGAPPPGRVGAEPPETPAAHPAPAEPAEPGEAAEPREPAAPRVPVAQATPAAPSAATATQPVSRQARIVGTVELRQGDGSLYAAPLGPCTVQITALDATLSWADHGAQGPVALPLSDFNRHLLDRNIEYVDTGPR